MLGLLAEHRPFKVVTKENGWNHFEGFIVVGILIAELRSFEVATKED